LRYLGRLEMIKRLFDITAASAALVCTSPILITTPILIKATSKGPVFFKQQRLGKDGDIFPIYKFRTMTDKSRDFNNQVHSKDDEITRIGKVIRRLKIDELPQLFNVLIGDMSLVGPRPCLPSLKEEFNQDAEKRLLVRPGLTGLAQVNGNIYLSWEERWQFDRKYVEEQSLSLDLKIILKTILIVVCGEEWGKK